jgi:hypothetical protein
LQCYIQRKIEGDGASKMFPIYELCTKDDRFLLVGIKRCDLSSCALRTRADVHLSLTMFLFELNAFFKCRTAQNQQSHFKLFDFH